MRRTSRLRANIAAGALGAVAAIGVVGFVVAFGGITFTVPDAPAAATAAETPAPEAAAAFAANDEPAAKPASGTQVVANTSYNGDSLVDRFRAAPETVSKPAFEEDAPPNRSLPFPAPLSAGVPAFAARPRVPDVANDPPAAEAASIEADEVAPGPEPAGDAALAYAPVPATRTKAQAAAPEPATDVAALPDADAVADTPGQPQPGSGRMVVSGSGANVRSGPGMAHDTLFALAGGSEVTPTGETTRGWLRVTDAEGRDGWIYGDYLQRQ